MPLLSVKNCTVRFGERIIVDQVSFDLNKGEILAVIGPNGSGKTTLLRAILNLVPYDGEVEWAGKPRIGYVPQRFDFDRTFPLSVREAFLLRLPHAFWRTRAPADAEIRLALRAVGAEHLIDVRIGVLSGGELQRILVAYSLIGKPDILCFDEPSTGIDAFGEETIYHLIHRLAHEAGLTVILISHDMDIVYQHATSVLCINRKLVCHGVPQEVLTGEMLRKVYGHHAGTYEHHHIK